LKEEARSYLLWKRLWTCRKTENRMMMMMIMMVVVVVMMMVLV